MLVWCVIGAITAWARNVDCQESRAVRAHRIVMIGNSGNASTEARVRAELESDGWQVVAVDDDNDSLQSVALANDAIAVIRVKTSPPTCEIWASSPTQESAAGTETIEGSPEATAILAIQAVEALRARLLKIGINSPKSNSSPPARLPLPTVRVVESKVTPVPRHWPVWLGVGSTLVGSRGGFSPNLVAVASVTTKMIDSLTVGTRIWLPISEAKISQPEGTSRLWQGSAAAVVGYELGRPSSSLLSRLSIGAGAQYLRFNAEVNPTYTAHAPRQTTGLSFLELDIVQRLNSRLRIGLGLTSGITWTRPVLRVVDRDVAAWGRPFYAVGLLGEFDVVPN